MSAFGNTDAAVLVPVYDDGASLVVVLTERRADLRRHAGEISFPGGRRDPGEDLMTTALREAHEEIGLDPAEATVVGALPPTTTLVTRFRVYPFVAQVPARDPDAWRLQDDEVARVLHLNLDDLRAGRRMRPLPRLGVPVPTVSFTVDGHLVWGATARMIDGLLRRLE